MAKKKKRNKPNNAPRRFIESIRKTLFGEKLESAIAKPILEKRPVEPKVASIDSVRPVAFVRHASGETPPSAEPVARVVAHEEPPKFEVPSPPKQPLDRAAVARWRETIARLFNESQNATSPAIKLGIDLGTSSSKVVWRGDSSANPVCFGSNRLNLQSYLVPSLVAFEEDDVLAGLEIVARTASSRISNFKMCLACTSQDSGGCGLMNCSLTSWPLEVFSDELAGSEVHFVNSCFLAKLIASVKSTIKSELSKSFQEEVNPKWTANLSIPETFIEQSPIADTFREVLRTAWLMSEVFSDQPDLVNRQSVFECFLAARSLARDSLAVLDDIAFGCSIYSEIGAEVASIVMSRTTPLGLYAFVDIGAGTIDASLFNYFRESDGKPNRPPYAAAVSNELGAARIEIHASRLSVDGNNFGTEALKQIKETLLDLNDREKILLRPQLDAIESVFADLTPKVQKFLQTVFKQARDEKDREIVRETIRLVVGGGGSHLQRFRSASIDAFTLKDAKNPKPPEVVELTVPDDLDFPLPSAEFHRFSVAYGLSFPIDQLPRMVHPKDVERKATPKKRDRDRGSWYNK